MRLTLRSFALAVVALLLGCPLTLSRPTSEAHLDALASGDRHLHHGRTDAAERAYGEAAREADRRVDRDEARYRRSRALRRAGRQEEALEELQRIAETRPVSRRTARAIYDMGIVREELGDGEGARREFERVTREFSDSGLGARALRRWLEGEADPALSTRLEALYLEVRETEIADDVLHWLAELAETRGDRASVRRQLERIVRNHPYPHGHRWDDATVTLAEMDLQDEAPERALERLKKMLERSEGTSPPGSYTLPTFPRAQLMIARIFRDYLRDIAAAAAAFRRVASDYPTSILRDDALVEAGEMWLDEGQTERGCELLEDVVEEFEVGRARRRAASRVAEACAP